MAWTGRCTPGGLFERLLDGLVSLDRAPVWLRDWIIFEREATLLRWLQPMLVPGLLQTEEYARGARAGRPAAHAGGRTARRVAELAGSFTLAKGRDFEVAHLDHTLHAQVVERREAIDTLIGKWEPIRGEALPRTQSIERSREVAATWQT